MYAAVSTFTLKAGNAAAIEQAAPPQGELIRSQPGCQYVAFVKLSDEQFVLFQVFETQQQLEAARTATMGKGMARLGDVLANRESKQGEVLFAG